ncbi:MAG: GNAT family N-acetyltransferase [Phenylobacterium sp. RIFCSPHIGHO2_01_FULL_69_31]|uniref:GNAT family N-acetyltransferase n=1 Tax=Phenylobacterium sp. RIFCSPHIGHO2_01_FULL_69_31 TaxID=1801944 RepID=UPI0008B75FA0|nr:N-acetyltransferase [Phenylobacterium sp. RIFCSPHIGHO2_01_FULL_69_31]OHB26183.1 MAG: GNAT family N-acetyltransferase [Phenylobacterium sp. RIFCSPHIGHO2_01_FULL_69_31]
MSLQPDRPPPELIFVNESPAHAAQVEALLNRAFGPGRFAKVSERVREFADFAPELSFCALEAGKVVGVVRMWRISVGDQPVVFLGPLAVEETERRHGLGAQLVERACAATEAAGEPAVLLVGDLPYFQRVGFAIAPDVTLPGPVDARRVLARSFGDLALSGPVRAR